MAGKKKNNSSKKNFHRRKKRSSAVVTLGRQPVPDTALVKLRYCQTIGIDAGAGYTNSRLFRANSLYDPDYSSTSSTQHQPLGFDQWMAFYQIYCVLGAKITVTPVNTSSTIPLIFGVTLRQGNVTLAVDPNTLREQGDSSWRYAGNMSDTGRKSVTKKFSTKKFLGFPHPTNENSCRASATGNPASPAYFQVWVAAADGIANPPNTSMNITIDYIAHLSQPKVLSQS